MTTTQPAPSTESNCLARHFLAEYFGCKPGLLDDIAFLEDLLRGAASAARTTLLEVRLHKFSPQGVSGVAILAESHLAIHTWPEHGFASIEIYVCGDDARPEAGHAYLLDRLSPAHTVTRLVPRGSIELVRQHSPATTESLVGVAGA